MVPCNRWWLSMSALAIIAIALSTLAPAQARDKAKIEKLTLQYRNAFDALAPSMFMVLAGGGPNIVTGITWDLPRLEDKNKQEAQDKAKKAFDDLIQNIEKVRKVNGVEFECQGEWNRKTHKLRLTSVPQLTEAGKKRLEGDR